MGDFASLVDDLGRPAVGTWIKLPSVEACEIVVSSGFDFVIIDLEHSQISLETAQQLVMVAERSGTCPLVRVPLLDASVVNRVLDAGTAGLLVPHCESSAAVERAVSYCHYPPRGVRGLSLATRAGEWGQRSRADHVLDANSRRFVLPQFESEAAISEVRATCGLDGIAAVFVGRTDLSVSMGLTEDDPTVEDLVLGVVQTCKRAGVLVGTAVGSVQEHSQQAVLSQMDFVVVGTDVGLLASATRSTARRSIDALRRTLTDSTTEREGTEHVAESV